MKKLIVILGLLLPSILFAQQFPSSFGWSFREAPSDSSMLSGRYIYNESTILSTRISSFVKDGTLYMYSYINKSSDAGKSWNIVYERKGDTIPIHSNLECFGAPICFNADWYWVHNTKNHAILETKDGGQHWNSRILCDANGDSVNVFRYCTKDSIIVCANLLNIYRISKYNGELHSIFRLRKNTTLPNNFKISNMGIAGDSVIYIMAEPLETSIVRYLVKSNNLGSTWEMIQLPDSTFNVYFYNSKIGWIAKSKPRNMPGLPYEAIYKTEDGGNTWVEQRYLTDSENGRTNDFYFWNENEGIALGNMRFLTTINGGKTWEEDSITPYKGSAIEPSNGLSKYHLWVSQSIDSKLYQYCEKMLPVSEPVATPLLAVPTPFTDEARIEFDVEQAGAVSVLVRNSMGELVAQREYYSQSGRQSFSLAGAELPAGIYFCDIVANGKTYRAKAVLVR